MDGIVESVQNVDGYAVLSWPSVSQANRYAVFMDGHLLATVAETSFQYDTHEPMMTHTFVVRSMSDFNFGPSADVILTQDVSINGPILRGFHPTCGRALSSATEGLSN